MQQLTQMAHCKLIIIIITTIIIIINVIIIIINVIIIIIVIIIVNISQSASTLFVILRQTRKPHTKAHKLWNNTLFVWTEWSVSASAIIGNLC